MAQPRGTEPVEAPPEKTIGRAIDAVGNQIAPRWVAPLFLGMAVLLVPWIAYLFVTLPHRIEARHYNVAWAGFDVALLVALSRTAYLAFHQRREMELSAVASSTLLLVDAWFDVTTAHHGWPLVEAILLAVFVELPLAALAIYLSRRVERLTGQRKR